MPNDAERQSMQMAYYDEVLTTSTATKNKTLKICTSNLSATKPMKHFQLITAMALCIFGCTMLVAGFVCPPLGEIHHSVLIAFGEILTFSGSLIGIDYKYRYKE